MQQLEIGAKAVANGGELMENPDKNSMLYWYPMIRDLDIPQPKTAIYKIPKKELGRIMETNAENLDMKLIKKVAGRIGYPLFLRTDQASGKHSWDRTCYVPDSKSLKSHIFEVISFNYGADICGLPFKALIFRKYIQMDTLFTAFWGNMPVNPEVRFFINNGNIACYHWYWIEDAIKNPSRDDWKELIAKAKETVEIDKLKQEAQKVAGEFKEGYWSVDFCRSKDQKWYLIDMATGEDSWHDESCNKRPIITEKEMLLKRLGE